MAFFGIALWLVFIALLVWLGKRGQQGFLIGALIVVNAISAALFAFF